MSYLVLARKYRPSQFADLVGQETIAQILRNAISSDRVAHAFLFSGPRGVGKTSTARILTKAINCTNLQDSMEPCNQCNSCLGVIENSSPDVFEIDAASNRGIENIRELRENIKYSPANHRYKVYIIDEAHMLTLESFNALLKTLEEPPSHIKFILATTDPHKIPQTILSRCQRYDFLRIPLQKSADFLEQVALKEKIGISRSALEMIAQSATGGMRDALTALDQVRSYAGETASNEQVAQVLGMMHSGSRFALLEAILKKDAQTALEVFYELQQYGQDFADILTELLQWVKNISLLQTVATSTVLFQDLPQEEVLRYQQLSQHCSFEELQQIFSILLTLEERLKRSTHAQICFEMAILQITSLQPLVGLTDLLQELRQDAVSVSTTNSATPSKTGASPSQLLEGLKKKVNNSSDVLSTSEENREKNSIVEIENSPTNSVTQDTLEVSSNPFATIVESRKTKRSSTSIASEHLNPESMQDVHMTHSTKIKDNFLSISESTKPKQFSINQPIHTVESVTTKQEQKTEIVEELLETKELEKIWEHFIYHLQEVSSRMASTLKNTIPLQLTEHQLRLAVKSLDFLKILRSSLKELNQEGSQYFNRKMEFIVDETPLVSERQTLYEREQHRLHLMRQEKEEQAKNHEQVRKVLDLFEGSTIKNIEIQS